MSDNSQNGDEGAATQPKLFLSYTRADIDLAGKLRAILQDRGFDVWWDQALEGGVNYLPTTEAALEGADSVVVLWSKLSVDSSWVRDEAQRGRERGCLVPVSLDGTMSPLGFRQIQLIDINGWSGKSDAPEIDRIDSAIRNQIAAGEGGAEAGSAPQPISAPRASQGHSLVSRRALMLGGVGLAGGAAAFAVWQSDLFSALDEGGVMTMAVLRFANLTGQEEQSWFSDGLSNELRQALLRNPRLRVSAPTSSISAEDQDDFEIGRALGVNTILRGNVQQVDATIRISAELVEVDGGVVLWSESYDREFSDVLAVQTEIAETVAFSLVQRVASETAARRSIEEQKGVGGTEDVRAFETFLRGMSLYALSAGADSDRAALSQFNAAVEIDPGYASAHAMRANMLAALANTASDIDEIEVLLSQSLDAAKLSIELAPDLSEGHLALGYVLYYGQFDRAAAHPHYRRAEELAPGDADTQRSVAVFYAYGKQHALATRMVDVALELDPLNPLAFRSAGFVALLGRDYGKTIEHMNAALALNPELAAAQYAIGTALYMQDDLTGALDAYAAEQVPVFSWTGLAITRAKLGDQSGAQSAFDALVEEYGDASLYQQVQVLAQWGEAERALTLLAQAFEVGDTGVLLATNDPLIDPIRGMPELDRLLLPLTS